MGGDILRTRLEEASGVVPRLAKIRVWCGSCDRDKWSLVTHRYTEANGGRAAYMTRYVT